MGERCANHTSISTPQLTLTTDRLLSNPWAQPPLPHDWEVRPTYPRRNIPYYLAPLWDAAEFQRAVEAKLSGSARRGSARHRGKSNKHGSLRHPGMSPIEEAAASIPKEVKARLKRSRAAKGLLMDLEESVRGFVRAWNEHEHELQGSGSGGKSKARARADTLASTGSDADMVLVDETDEEDEEIVFVGRNGATTEMPTALAVRPKNPDPQIEQDAKDLHATIAREKLIFEGAEDDKGSSFARWLVHCVGTYYGLRTWSVTKKGVREAYVGVDERANGLMGRSMEVGSEKDVELPRPLWGMV